MPGFSGKKMKKNKIKSQKTKIVKNCPLQPFSTITELCSRMVKNGKKKRGKFQKTNEF